MPNKMMDRIDDLADVFMILGGLAWAFIAFIGTNPVEYLLGNWPTLMKILYGLIGASSVWELIMLIRGKN